MPYLTVSSTFAVTLSFNAFSGEITPWAGSTENREFGRTCKLNKTQEVHLEAHANGLLLKTVQF